VGKPSNAAGVDAKADLDLQVGSLATSIDTPTVAARPPGCRNPGEGAPLRTAENAAALSRFQHILPSTTGACPIQQL